MGFHSPSFHAMDEDVVGYVWLLQSCLTVVPTLDWWLLTFFFYLFIQPRWCYWKDNWVKMASALNLKVWLDESDGCMTKAQRLNTHDLTTTSESSEWLRSSAIFTLWESFLQFKFDLFTFDGLAFILITLPMFDCINCSTLYFLLQRSPLGY